MGRVAWCPRVPVWALERGGPQVGVGGAVYRGGAGSAQGLKQGCHGAHIPSTAALGEEKQPVSAHDPFWFRVMARLREAGPFQRLWKALPAGALVSHPPPSWCRGYPQGVRGKRPGQSYSTWELPPSPSPLHHPPPQGPLRHLGILQRAEVLGVAGRGDRHEPMTFVFLETPFPPTCRATLVSFPVCACHQTIMFWLMFTPLTFPFYR